MLVHVSKLDSYSYLFQMDDDKEYLVFHHDINEHKKTVHVVEVEEGQEDMFLFIKETFTTEVWVIDDYWLAILIYSMCSFIVEGDLSLDNPESLYYSMGGAIERPPNCITYPGVTN